VILALPRGGVPVAAEVAAKLEAPLDLILVRKIGVPFQPELAMGAVVDGGSPIVVRNEDVILDAGISEQEFNTIRDPSSPRSSAGGSTIWGCVSGRRSPAARPS
jgi:predicted phosphoribosyltransferase